MANPALERILAGGFAFFLEAYTTVDGVLVAGEPSANPPAGKPGREDGSNVA